MKEINARIAEIRSTLGLSMRAFAQRLGITAPSINKIESGENNPSEQTIKLICKEFSVDYFWLTEGTGEMFRKIPNTIIEKLSEKYHLNDQSQIILKSYLESPDDQKAAIENFLLKVAENLQKKDEE